MAEGAESPVGAGTHRKVTLWGCKRVPDQRVSLDVVYWFQEHTVGFFLTEEEAQGYMWTELAGGGWLWVTATFDAYQDVATGEYVVYPTPGKPAAVLPYGEMVRAKLKAQWEAARSKLTDEEYDALVRVKGV